MANVVFKRGLLAALPAAKVDGNVYVTTDERAMYVDYLDSGSVLQRIRLGDFREYANLAAVTALDHTNLSTTALYYAIAENILCKFNGTSWIQINAQKTVSQLIGALTIAVASTVANTSAKVTSTIVDTNATEVVHGDFTITSLDTDSLVVTAATGVVNLRVADIVESASLSAATQGSGVNLTLNNRRLGTNALGAAVDATTSGGTLTMVGSSGVTITVTGSTITVTGTKNTGVSNAFNASGGLVTTITDSNSETVQSAAITPTIHYGALANQSATFVSGTATLTVYTKGETDAAISNALTALNAMTFKGGLGVAAAGSVLALPTTAANGDMYKVVVAGTFAGQAAIVGDMFIATGTETAGAIPAGNLVWAYIPSGNEDVPTYTVTATTASWVLKNNASVVIGTIKPGTDLTMSVVGTEATLNHKTTTTTTPTGTAATQAYNTSLVINPITAVTVNNGHVTAVEKKQITLKDTHNAIDSASYADTLAANVATSRLTITDLDGTSKTVDHKIASNNLTIAASGNTTTIDLNWGSF